MLDLYEVLGIGPDAGAEDVKRAYKRMSLIHHPDKVQAAGAGGANGHRGVESCERFNHIKGAYDVLQDADRRKFYDTFGFDMGEERLEMEVWNMGIGILLSPMATCVMKTVVTKMSLWLVSFRIGGIVVLLLALIYAALFAMDFTYKGQSLRDPSLMIVHLAVAIAAGSVVLQWVWSPLADAAVIMFLASEFVGLDTLVVDKRIIAGAGLGSLFIAWLVQGRWLWVLGIEVILAFATLVALTVAAGIMRLWVDSMYDKHSEKLATWRTAIRSEKARLLGELSDLKRRLREAGM